MPVYEVSRMVYDLVIQIAEGKADYVAVVRCKDCKHWEKSDYLPSLMVCKRAVGIRFVCNEEDFCSRGKKRGGDND